MYDHEKEPIPEINRRQQVLDVALANLKNAISEPEVIESQPEGTPMAAKIFSLKSETPEPTTVETDESTNNVVSILDKIDGIHNAAAQDASNEEQDIDNEEIEEYYEPAA